MTDKLHNPTATHDESATIHATIAADHTVAPPMRMWTKVLGGFILTLIALVLFFGPTETGESLLELWDPGAGPIGALSFAVVYIAATTVFIPAVVLAVGAGFLFGGVWGSIIAVLCRPLGALAALIIGRYVARDRVRRWTEKWEDFDRIDKLVVDKPFRVVFLLRLFPIIPFNMANYVFGVTGVEWKRYLIATFLGVAPGTLVYAYLGTTAGGIAEAVDEPTPMMDFIPWLVGASLLVMTLTLLVTYGRRRWKKLVVEEAKEVESS